ncbi:hypothetical protein [Croceiramulus getboli]|nr:hypothetical protein P8624_13155 [Flavobacteriaceae bacterium YJPT1-3]
MKKALIIAFLFLLGTGAQATAVQHLDHGKKKGKFMRYQQESYVSFIQQGVEYFVFADGSFDFSILERSINTRRRGNTAWNNSPGRSRLNYNSRFPYRNFIRYNRWGQIRMIGNTPIFYQRNGKVAQIGRVDIRHKRGWLDRVGNLKVHYDRLGRINRTTGHVFRGNKGRLGRHYKRNHNRHQEDWYEEESRSRSRFDD